MRKTIRCRRECCVENRFSAIQKTKLVLGLLAGGTRFVSAQGAEKVKAMHLCIMLERQTQPMRKTIRCRRECCVENRFSAKQKTKLMLGLLAGGTRFVSAQGAEIVKTMHLCIVFERQTQPCARQSVVVANVAWRIAFLQNKKPSSRLVFWQGGRDSNTQPAVLETAALPLSHPPKFDASKL